MKIIYRIIVSNSILKEMGVTHHNLCNFCQKEKDSVYHYLWKCNIVQDFWNNLLRYIKERCGNTDRLTLNANLILFGYDINIKTDCGLNFILLQAKYFVYTCRFHEVKPTVQSFIKTLSYTYKTDKYVHRLEMNYNKFDMKWLPYLALLENN